MRSQPVSLTPDQSRLAAENIGLAHGFARRMRRRYALLEFDDLVGIACHGLCEAIARWNPERGEFSTVAWLYMRKCANDANNDLCGPSRVSHDARNRIDPDCQRCTPEKQCCTCHRRHKAHEFMSMRRVSSVKAEIVAAREEHEQVEPDPRLAVAMAHLTPRERCALLNVTGSKNGKNVTLKNISSRLGVSRERVRQIKEEALAKLRAELRAS